MAGDLIDLAPFVTSVGEAAKGYRLGKHVAENLDDAVSVTAKGIRTFERFSEGFGTLSSASEYGIDSYRSLRKALSGTGLEAHHIIEQRVLKGWNHNCNDALSVAVTKMEHYKFTSEWRKLIPYGTDYGALSKDEVWNAAQQVYQNYPALLTAAWDTIYGGG